MLLFDKERLMYDIENVLYSEGRVMETDRPELRSIVQDGGQLNNLNRLKRTLDLGVARIREILYPYTKREINEEVMNNHPEKGMVYGIEMNIGENFSETTLKYLEKLIHDYLVSFAIEDWLRITNPGKAVIWHEKWESQEQEIHNCLLWRRGRIRRRGYPF